MTTQVDLKRLIQLINDQKQLNANLCLDEGCTIGLEDQSSLVKVINYFLNYLQQMTDKPLEISLDLMSDSILLMLMAFSEAAETAPLSKNLESALKGFGAEYKTVHKSGQYLQIKVNFQKQ